MKKRRWKKPGEKMNVSHEGGRKRGKEEFEGLCLNVWRPRHLQHATSPFPEHFFCTQVGEKLSGKSETQSSKKELASGRGIKPSSPRLTALLFHLTVSLPSGNAAAPGP